MEIKKAVLLCSMGGPSSLGEVRSFLFHLFKDPSILRVPWGVRHMLAFGLAKIREKEARLTYEKMGGASPILKNTKAQAEALEQELAVYGSYRCFVGMSYAKPFIKEALKQIKTYQASEIILLPMYPQFSSTTTASVIRDVRAGIKEILSEEVKLKIIDPFYQEEGFLEATLHQFLMFYQKAKKYGEPRILFSAHGLPQNIVDRGDPYVQQCEETVQALIKRMGFDLPDWQLCYQSRLGPMEWTRPYLDEESEKAAQEGKPVLIVPISFVCEHAETLVELGQLYRKRALLLGAPYYGVVPTVQTHPAFIKGLSRLVTSC